MFDMETALAAWRQEMAARLKVPQRREELESHLREEIERQLRSGANEADAFAAAVAQIGPAQPIKAEFAKVDAESWSRPLARTAWAMFVISFFLPAYGEPSVRLQGWECARMSLNGMTDLVSSTEGWHDKGVWLWHDYDGRFFIHLSILTLANLLMLASPFLLLKFPHRSHAMNLFRRLSFAALLLVWAFFPMLAGGGYASHLKIGYYLWTFSFLPLWLCTLPRWREAKAKGKMSKQV